jgi:hypothetical protein
MSLNLANYDWIDGKEDGLIGQFATTLGYTELIAAARGHDYPVLADFFAHGVSADIKGIRRELRILATHHSSADVRSTALALRQLTRGQTKLPLVITNGAN